MNLAEKRRVKVSQVLRYFLADEKYSFTDAISTPDNIDEGYYIELIGSDTDYQTYLSSEYLDANNVDRIIAGITLSLNKLINYGDE